MFNATGLSDNPQTKGTLILIGGREDKEGDKVILREIAERIGKGKLVVSTAASHKPEGYFECYQEAFAGLGLAKLVELSIASRAEAFNPDKLAILDNAAGVFFTGGNQFKLTNQLGHTPLEQRIRELYETGGLVAGTSAGASALATTMLLQGTTRGPNRLGDLRMVPGLGLIDGVIIDQHFSQRGRMVRLLGAVAQNPRELGIGIDEDTAIVIKDDRCFYVLGSGAVYVLDSDCSIYSNIAEDQDPSTRSLYDVRLCLLSHGDAFDLRSRRPHTLERAAAA